MKANSRAPSILLNTLPLAALVLAGCSRPLSGAPSPNESRETALTTATTNSSSLDDSEFEDLSHVVEYNRGYAIRHKHEGGVLSLETSTGWLWAHLKADSDLRTNSILRLKVKTQATATVYLELKNVADQSLVGQTRIHSVPKYLMKIPDTKGEVEVVSFDLRTVLCEGVKDCKPAIIAFSDPVGKIEISGFGFSADGPK